MQDWNRVIDWLQISSPSANPKKSAKPTQLSYFNYVEVKRKTTVTFLGLLVDEKLSFKQHVNTLYRKSNLKTNGIKPISSYLNIYRSYIYSNFL